VGCSSSSGHRNSGSIKSFSLVLVIFAFLIFFNWLYLATTVDSDVDEWSYFEGLWGAAPLLVTGIVGLTTACRDTPCRRILLIVTSSITLPSLGGLLVCIGNLFSESYDSYYQYRFDHCTPTGYIARYTLEDCLSDYINCKENGYVYDCSSSFQRCIFSDNNYYFYDLNCDALEVYSVTQMCLTVLAILTDFLILILTAKHHCSCCGATQSGTVHAPGNTTAPPGSVVYMVPQGYTMPPNTGVLGYPAQGQHQLVHAQQPYQVDMSGAGASHQAMRNQPPEYTENKNL